jgi:hypothetical protein
MKTPIRSLITLLCAAIGTLTLAISAQVLSPRTLTNGKESGQI